MTGCITLLLVGCDATAPVNPPDNPDPADPQEPLPRLRMEAATETSLAATVGAVVATSPKVRLVMLDGTPAAGRDVYFSASGAGHVEVSAIRTDTLGVASPGRWTLGPAAGTQTLTARSSGVTAVVFTALAKAGAASSVTIAAGDHQSTAAGGVLPVSLKVKVADSYGNPVPGQTVTFTQVFGSGTIAGGSATTDSFGFASAGPWTLSGAGAHVARATAAGKEVFFGAFACGDPCRGRDFLFSRGDGLFTQVGGVAARIGDPVSEPVISPDARQIAFTVWQWDETASLYTMNADGTNLVYRGDFYSPSWSPDGRQLAITGYDGGSDQTGVFTLNFEDDAAQPVLLRAGAWNAVWSPDGTRIAFTEYDGAGLLRVMNADGTGAITLVSYDEAGVGHATWSPDGQRLAFHKCGHEGCDIYSVTLTGADLKQLSHTGTGSSPAWSPDGSRIAFSSDGGIFWLPADGSVTKPFLLLADSYAFDWIP